MQPILQEYAIAEPRVVETKVDIVGAEWTISGFVEFKVTGFPEEKATVIKLDVSFEDESLPLARTDGMHFTLRVPFVGAKTKSDALFQTGNIIKALTERFNKAADEAKAS